MKSYSYEDYREALNAIFQKYANKIATVSFDNNFMRSYFTYGQFKLSTDDFGLYLCDIGLKRADRVAIISPCSVYSSLTVMMLTYLGYTTVMIDSSLPMSEINRLVRQSDVAAVFTTGEIYEKLNDTENLYFEICFKENVYRELTDTVSKTRRHPVISTEEDVIAIIFSSGTTGNIKGVRITYSSVMNAYYCMTVYSNVSDKMWFLNVLPASHIAGYTSVISCFLCGAEQGFLPQVNAEYLSKGLLEYSPSHFIMIPKIYDVIREKILSNIRKRPAVNAYYRIMTRISRLARRRGIRLRPFFLPIISAAFGKRMINCSCGTAPCPNGLAEFYLDMGLDFINVYGSTEACFPITAINRKKDRYPAKGVGNINQFPEIEIKIDKPDKDGNGEILVKSPLMMKGYFNDPELTEQAFEEQGFFKTGDIGYVDSSGQLYITGRAKEIVLLRNGNKASPDDVEQYYREACPNNCVIACCGIPARESGYDEIHLFVQANGVTAAAQEKIKSALMQKSKEAGSIYGLKQIHFIKNIPLTSVGKVKRYLLKEMVKESEEQSEGRITAAGAEQSVTGRLINIIENSSGQRGIRPSDKLIDDLQLDSLTMVEICVKIEEEWGIFIGARLDEIKSVEDIAAFIETGDSQLAGQKDNGYSVEDYPLKRGLRHRIAFKATTHILRFIYNIHVFGAEHIPMNTNFIVCPNHETHLDGMFVWSAMNKKCPPINHIVCLAADYLLKNPLTRLGLVAMGGIPVDRTGNAVPATHRAEQYLKTHECCFLIHPEGTRTRDGNLGAFKLGAAQISAETNIPVVPVRIKGGYSIFPAHRKRPKLFDWKHFRRYSLNIYFARPIYPDGRTAQEITDELRQVIESIG